MHFALWSSCRSPAWLPVDDDAAAPAPGGAADTRRPSFYALSPGGWRDYVTLLHPPYTVWHLSYVAMGAAVAPTFNGARLGLTIAAFFLAVGVTAHAFDELAGRPLGTRIPGAMLRALGFTALAGAMVLGVVGALEVSWWILPFIGFGAFVVIAYNLELFGGRFHSDLWFAVSWGAFPALTAGFAQAGRLTVAIGAVAAACLYLSLAQRRLSTPVRALRRSTAAVEGRVVMRDGRTVPIDDRTLRAAPESALRALWPAMALLSGGMVAARLL
jgi:hypothetical protein